MKSYINPLSEWRGPVPMPQNAMPDRMEGGISHSMDWAANDPSWIVLHTEVGVNTGAEARFMNAASQVSAHYGVSEEGHIVQWVDEKDGAYCDGNFHYNMNGVGIEHEDGGDYNGVRPDVLYVASAKLVRDICIRYGIPITRQWILKHHEVPGSSTACPDALDVDRIVAMASGAVVVPPVVVPPVRPAIVTPYAPIHGVIYDSASNDRSFLDYNTVAYVPNEVAAIGQAVVWLEAKLVAEPSSGTQKWLLKLAGTTWAVWDDCVDDTDADHDEAHSSPPNFIVDPHPVVPPVVVHPVDSPVVIVPPVVKPPVDPAIGFWAALYAWLVKWFK